MAAAPGVFGLGMPRSVGVEFEESVFPVVDLQAASMAISRPMPHQQHRRVTCLSRPHPRPKCPS